MFLNHLNLLKFLIFMREQFQLVKKIITNVQKYINFLITFITHRIIDAINQVFLNLIKQSTCFHQFTLKHCLVLPKGILQLLMVRIIPQNKEFIMVNSAKIFVLNCRYSKCSSSNSEILKKIFSSNLIHPLYPISFFLHTSIYSK